MKTKLKKSTSIIFIIVFILFYGCGICEECANNLDSLVGQFTKYKEGDIVEFENSDIGIIQDTVRIKYYPPNETYGCGGGFSKEPYLECSGNYTLRIGDFYTKLIQYPNEYSNGVFQEAYLGKGTFDLIDTISNYKFKDVEINVKYYQRRDTSFSNKDYFDFYLSFDNKLMEFGIKDGQIIERWFLRE